MLSYLPGKFFGKPPLVRQKEQDKSFCLSFFTEQNKKLIKKLLLARRQVFSSKFRQNKTKKNGTRIETAGQFLREAVQPIERRQLSRRNSTRWRLRPYSRRRSRRHTGVSITSMSITRVGVTACMGIGANGTVIAVVRVVLLELIDDGA